MQETKEHYHFIGMGGIGMSGLARILLEKKVSVSGSDKGVSPLLTRLEKMGAKVYLGHSADYVEPGMTVVYSSGIPEGNPELLAAKEKGCQLLHRSEFLHELTHGYKTLAVAGTHGKTTTSAILTEALIKAKVDPAFAVGGILPALQVNSGFGKGEYFVAEADESDGTFLQYAPFGAIITNIDNDHMNHFKTREALVQAFATFASKVQEKEHLFFCGEDETLLSFGLEGHSYGFDGDFSLQGRNFQQEGWEISFDAEFQGREYKDFRLPTVGRHNALNALAVLGLALSLGISEEEIRNAFATFGGIGRRVEKKGEVQGVLVLDDYAHHPTEIQVTLEGIRKAKPEHRLWVVFQPHRYSRTVDNLGHFGGVFAAADEVVITDLYAAGEAPIPGVSAEKILEEVEGAFIRREELLDTLAKKVRPHDVVVMMGAGDITSFSGKLVEKLKNEGVNKLKVAVISGGPSVEHEVSLVSGKFFVKKLRSELYDVISCLVSKEGEWSLSFEELKTCDVVIPALHGPWGEDGNLQGFLSILGIPFVGSDHRASAICMDKRVCKKLLMADGIPTLPFVSLYKEEMAHPEKITEKVEKILTYPVFVKPSHLGSSVGLSKVEKREDLLPALKKGFLSDTDVIVEQGKKIRELEFAVMGNQEIITFPPGEILSGGEVYSYEAKYGKNGFGQDSRADIPEPIMQEGMMLAKKMYQALGCTGFARMDCFLEEGSIWWANEANPIPGFTEISLYPQICERSGISHEEMVDRFVRYALSRERRNQKITTSYE